MFNPVMKTRRRWLLAGLLLLVILGFAAALGMRWGLRAEIVPRKEDYGIPGITKNLRSQAEQSRHCARPYNRL